jgi:hypothetical protein
MLSCLAAAVAGTEGGNTANNTPTLIFGTFRPLSHMAKKELELQGKTYEDKFCQLRKFHQNFPLQKF